MKSILKFSFRLLAVSACACLAAESQTMPLPTMDQVRAKQALGRFVISPTGRFFLYEWSRPNSFYPNDSGVEPSVSNRMETTLFLVNATLERATSEYLILP